MPGTDKKFISWADEVEENESNFSHAERERDEAELPPAGEVIYGDKGDMKVVTKYDLSNSDGKKVKTSMYYRIERKLVSKSIAKRKAWKKFGAARSDPPFGPNPANTIVCEEIFMQFLSNNENEEKKSEDIDPLAKLKGQKVVKCRICKDDHWTTQCPYKEKFSAIPGDLKDVDAKPVGGVSGATTAASSVSALAAQNEANPSRAGKYIPPSMRDGTNRRAYGESMTTRGGRDETSTIRVTNLSEDVRDSDLSDLFRPFGTIARIYLAKDKATGQSKGFAFISFHRREDAAEAIQQVNGFGYDNLILSVEYAKPSGSN